MGLKKGSNALRSFRLKFTGFLKLIVLIALPALAIGFFTLRQQAHPAAAQNLPTAENACPDFITQVLGTLEQNCSGVGRNTACYGNTQVNATFTEPVPPAYFSEPADTTDLVTLQSISTTQIDLEGDSYGVALMSMQANLPGTLPGQAVNFLLFGDATVVNAVTPDSASLPVDPVNVFTASDAPIYTLAAANANIVEVAPAGTDLAADALSEDGAWVRIVYLREDTIAVGGWVALSALLPFDQSALPVVGEQTRTPMQAFLFRTGLGAPICDQAPNQVVIQGPTNTQVSLNVNGADIVVGSTVTMQSVSGAPEEIVEILDLPPEIQEQLNVPDDPNTELDESNCAVMELGVVSGQVILNEGTVGLPAGNNAYSVYCGVPPEQETEGDPEATPDPSQFANFGDVDYASQWGAFTPMTEEELEQLEPLEQISSDVLNYEITLPDPDDIQPPFDPNAPEVTPEPYFGGGGIVNPTAEVTAEPTAQPTSQPTSPPPDAGVPAYVQVNQGSGQTATVGQPFPIPFVARLLDPYSNPVGGVAITFTAPTSGASGTFAATGTNTETVVTDSSGYATASAFTSNTVSGSYSVIASAPTSTAYSSPFAKRSVSSALMQTVLGTFSVSNAPDGSANIVPLNGSGQSTTYNTAFDNGLQAQVVDQFGNGVPGVTVTFTAPNGGASATLNGLLTVDVVTNGGGIAVSPVPVANGQVGTYSILATSGSFITSFTLTNDPPIIQVTSGSPQSATVLSNFAAPLQAQITDDNGNGLSGLTVTFTAPASGASALFGETATIDAVTDGSGIASSGTFNANIIAGNYSVTASSVFGISTQFSLTNTSGAPSSVEIVSGSPQSATVTTPFANPLVARVTDDYNNPVPGVIVTFTAPDTGASGTFAATGSFTEAVTTDSAGEAVSSLFTANTVAGSYIVTPDIGMETANFSLTNTAAAAASLTVFGGTPQNTAVGTAFAAPLQASLTDSFGNGIMGASVTFTAPATGASGTFQTSGSNTEDEDTDASGVATASTFTANGVPGGYAVSASYGSLTANFSLTNNVGAPAILTVTGGNNQSTTVATNYAAPLTVSLTDSFGNPISGVNVTFTMPGGGARAAFVGDVFTETSPTNAGGSVSTTTMTATGTAGAFTVSISSGSLNTSASLTNLPGAPANLIATGGTPQAADVGVAFSVPLQAQLTDSLGNPIAGQLVTFTAPGSGASGTFAGTGTNTESVNTDSGGFATSSTFTANLSSGGYTVTASLGVLTANFSLTNNAPTIVTNLLDSGAGSLRDVVAAAAPGSTITFSVTGTITLSSVIGISQNLTIDGPGAGSLVISGGGVDRVFIIGAAVTIQDVRITNGTGNGSDGGLLYVNNSASLTLNFVQLDAGVSVGLPCCEKGGAIFSQGALTITNSGIYNNTAGQGATAIMIWTDGTVFSVTDSCISGNFGAAGTDIMSLIGGSAENNWWGDPGGPGVGAGDSIVGVSVGTFRVTPIAGVPGC